MSRLLALVAVAVIAFACAPRPVTVAPVEPLGEVTDADEPFLVDSEIEVDVPYLNESIGCLPETDRLDKQTFDEMVTADRIGPPDDGMGGTLPRPLSPPATPLSRRFWKADPRWLRESGA